MRQSGFSLLIRFLVVELTYSASNPKFDMVLYLRLIILSVGGDVPVNNKTLLVTDFVNLKIKLTQSFRGAHRDNIYVRVFIKVSPQIYYIFKKRGACHLSELLMMCHCLRCN
jgi:hypothetical protein